MISLSSQVPAFTSAGGGKNKKDTAIIKDPIRIAFGVVNLLFIFPLFH